MMLHSKYKNIFFIGVLFFTPFFIYAAGAVVPPDGPGVIENPLKGTANIQGLIGNVISYLLGLAAMFAMLALIIGGLKIIAGFANPKSVEEGKKIITWAIIGLAIIGLSFVIIRVVTRDILGVI